jgi:predicted outer membrane repeat protein
MMAGADICDPVRDMQTGAGAYFNRCPDMSFVHTHFENNSATAGGGALEMNQCKGNIDTCTFLKNKASLPLPNHVVLYRVLPPRPLAPANAAAKTDTRGLHTENKGVHHRLFIWGIAPSVALLVTVW